MTGVCAGLMSGGAAAQETKLLNFQSLSPDQRYHWLHGSVMTAIHVISMYSRQQGTCASDWYFQNEAARRREIEQTYAKHQAIDSPTTIVIGLIVKACGPLGVRS